MLNNVLYADLTGVFLVVGCTLFISLVNCLSEIPSMEFPPRYLPLKVTTLDSFTTGIYPDVLFVTYPRITSFYLLYFIPGGVHSNNSLLTTWFSSIQLLPFVHSEVVNLR